MIGEGRHFRRQQRAADEDARVLPLINIVFLLLIFFMITGHMSAQAPFELEPLKSATGSHPHPEELTVFISDDGHLAVDRDALTLTELEALVRERQSEIDAALRVRLQADGRTEAVRVVAVMEALRAAGTERLELLALPER